MTEISQKTDEELINHLQGLHWSIYTVDCFATHDLFLYEYIWNELQKRGYEIKEITSLEIKKSEEDDEEE